MHLQAHHQPTAWLAPLFIAAVFYGDVWIGVTLPVSMLLLPLFFWAEFSRDRPFQAWPAGLLLHCGIGAIVAIQAVNGELVNGKGDAVAYLPVVYGAVTLFVLRGVAVSEVNLWRGIIGGGLLTGVVMCIMIAVAPNGSYLVQSQFLPGQESYAEYVERREGVQGAQGAPKTPDIAAKFSPAADEASYGMYEVKRQARNALGFSNYIAVFLVFSFTVALFTGHKMLCVVFGLLVAATVSRFGLMFLVSSIGLWAVHRRCGDRQKLALAFFLVVLLGIGVCIALADRIAEIPQLASLTARIAYWKSGLEVIADSPWLGRPRSYIMEQFGYSVFWNPHNALLWVGALLGVSGVLLYSAYLLCVLRNASQNAARSPLWTGIFFGLIIMITWSFVEQLALSPAFEILIAAMYALKCTGPGPSNAGSGQL
jgi:hypothetical protein